MEQLPLEILPAAEPDFNNFVPGPNAEAFGAVRSLARGELGERILYLWGEAGCGRTHLLRAATRANPQLVIADDVDKSSDENQQRLFIAINEARDDGPAVLVAGDKPPAQLALREDLKTRLAWGLVYQLQPLSDADKAEHLKNVAKQRGLQLSDDIVAYLLTRLPRNMANLQAVMEVLDRYSLIRKRALTLPLVREALAEKFPGGQSIKR